MTGEHGYITSNTFSHSDKIFLYHIMTGEHIIILITSSTNCGKLVYAVLMFHSVAHTTFFSANKKNKSEDTRYSNFISLFSAICFLTK